MTWSWLSAIIGLVVGAVVQDYLAAVLRGPKLRQTASWAGADISLGIHNEPGRYFPDLPGPNRLLRTKEYRPIGPSFQRAKAVGCHAQLIDKGSGDVITGLTWKEMNSPFTVTQRRDIDDGQLAQLMVFATDATGMTPPGHYYPWESDPSDLSKGRVPSPIEFTEGRVFQIVIRSGTAKTLLRLDLEVKRGFDRKITFGVAMVRPRWIKWVRKLIALGVLVLLVWVAFFVPGWLASRT